MKIQANHLLLLLVISFSFITETFAQRRGSSGRSSSRSRSSGQGRSTRSSPPSRSTPRRSPTTRPAPAPRSAPRSAPRTGERGSPSSSPRRSPTTRPTPAPRTGYSNPTRSNYNTRYYHRPYGNQTWAYNRNYQHRIYDRLPNHTLRYQTYRDYYVYVNRNYQKYIYVHWLLWPVTKLYNGYYYLDGYPYYVFNGYRHRYSSFDRCHYQLVDKYTHRVEQTWWDYTCNRGYDLCAYQRERMNSWEGDYRYFCAETYRDDLFDFRKYSYEYYDSGYRY